MNVNRNKITKTLIFFTLICFLKTALGQFLELSIQSSQSQVLKTTTHKIIIYIPSGGSDIPANSYLTLTYDASFDLSGLITTPNAQNFCETGCNINAISFSRSGSVLRMTGFFPTLLSTATKGYSILYTLSGIKNPSFVASNLNINIDGYEQTNSPLFLLSAVTQLDIQIADLGCSVKTLSNPTVSGLSNYTFLITPSIALPSSGFINLDFPTYWSSSDILSLLTITTSSLICSSNITDGSIIACSPINSTRYKIQNIFGSDRSSPFQFTFGQLTNPDSQQPLNDISLKYFNSGGNAIAQCNVFLSGMSHSTVSSLFFDIKNVNKVAQQGIGEIKFTTNHYALFNDQIKLQFDPSLSLKNLSIAFIYLGNQATTIRREVSINSTSNIVSILPFEAAQPTNYTIELYEIGIPNSLKPTNQINVKILRRNYLISSASCCSYTVPSANLTNITASLSLSDNKIGSTVQYAFQLTFNQVNFSKLQIQFPSQYSLTVGACSIIVNSQIGTPTCSIVSSTLVQLSNLGTMVFANVPFRFTLSNILNPPVNSPVISYRTISSNSYQIQTATSTIALTTTSISSALVYVSPKKVGSLSIYRFQISNTNILSPGAKVHIYSPEGQVIFEATAGITCLLGVASVTCSRKNNSYIVVDLPASSTFNPRTLATQNLTINSVRNPISTKVTESFKIQLESLSNIIEGTQTGLVVQMDTLQTFPTLIITPSSNYTFAETNYKIDFTLPFTIPATLTGVLKVIFPSEYLFMDCSICGNNSEIVLNPLTFSVTIDKIRNPIISTISSSVTVSLVIQDGNGNQYQSITRGITISSWQPRDQIFSISHNHLILSQESTVTINIDNLSSAASIIEITIPPEYTILGNTTVTVDSFLGTVTKSIVGNLIRISAIQTPVKSKNTSVVIKSLKNPAASPSSLWKVQTRDINSVKISSSQSSSSISNKFQTICQLPCRQCQRFPILNSTKCLSCYQNPLITTLTYLYKNSCINACLSSSFQVISTYNSLTMLNCYDCSSQCLTCANFSYNCTSCQINKVLFQSQCVDQCPDGYYPDSTSILRCLACTPPCYSCSLAANNCTSCTAGNLLTLTTATTGFCSNSCTSGMFNKSNICTTCAELSGNCSICTLVSGCTSCANSTYLYQKQCLVTCPKSFYIDNLRTTCEVCKSPCLTCSIASNNCTSCDTSNPSSPLTTFPYFHELLFSCLGSCPIGFYPNQQYKCKACILPCFECSSPKKCKNCVSNYKLISEHNQCVSQCPLKNSMRSSVEISGQCQLCVSPCQTCEGTPSNCTACVELYFLQGNLCKLTCSSNFVSYQRICRKCYPPCSDCISSSQPTQCLTCEPSYFKLSTSCYLSCPPGTFQSNSTKTCQLCTSGCYECQNTSSTCLSCQPGLFLLNKACQSNCPTTPVYYYEYQAQCISCQPQCLSCLTSPVQCVSCATISGNLYKHNVITKVCTASCNTSLGVFDDLSDNSVCKPCSLPCKSCLNYYDNCLSCFNGRFRHQIVASPSKYTCLQVCPLGYYQKSTENACRPCQNQFCQMCNQNKCLVCKINSYIYQGVCYQICPVQAQHVYRNKYCRNCLKDNCLLCSSLGECIMCQPGYYGFNGSCLLNCLQNYEPDAFTNSKCVRTEQSTLNAFLSFRQKLKMVPFTGVILFIVFLPLLFSTKSIPLILLNSVLSIPQTISYAFFTGFCIFYTEIVPFYVVISLLVLHFIFSAIHTLIAIKIFLQDKDFLKWRQFGSNYSRTHAILGFSFINKRLIYLLFSGCNWFAFCTYRLKNLDKFKPLNVLSIVMVILVEIPYLIAAIGYIVIEQAYIDNNKLLYSCLDVAVINLLSIIVTIWQVKTRNQFAQPYKRVIIKDVSTKCFRHQSENAEDNVLDDNDDDDLNLHRSGSDKNLVRSPELQKIQLDLNSVFDPEDYQDVPQIDKKYIAEAITKGKFRKKKRKHKKGFFRQELDVISQEESEENLPEKKKRKFKKRTPGQMNNYIYWKPPKQKKKQEAVKKVIYFQEKQIMQKIKEKESQFDTITRNDLVFQEDQNDNYQNYKSMSMSDSDYNEDGSRRDLKEKVDYHAYFNLNYAGRKHLG